MWESLTGVRDRPLVFMDFPRSTFLTGNSVGAGGSMEKLFFQTNTFVTRQVKRDTTILKQKRTWCCEEQVLSDPPNSVGGFIHRREGLQQVLPLIGKGPATKADSEEAIKQ